MNRNRDEIRLSTSVVDRLGGQFVFTQDSVLDAAGLRAVDVGATNERVALNGKRLSDFVAVPPDDPAIDSLEAVAARARPLSAKRLAIVLLCGGLSFRSRGLVHPLLEIRHPETGRNVTLLDLQLERFERSPLHGAARLIVGTPSNEDALRSHLAHLPGKRRPELYVGGMAPRLLPRQSAVGQPLEFRDESGMVSWNPIGHFEALRWLVLTGLLGRLREIDVVLFASYSNWGRYLTEGTLAVAGHAMNLAQQRRDWLFCAEVTPRPQEKRSGAILVRGSKVPHEFRLIKYSYGRDAPEFPPGGKVLMSTNLLYFSRANLLERLAAAAAGLDDAGLGLADRQAMESFLANLAAGDSRDLASRILDAALPVPPHAISVSGTDGPLFLRIERDLDQLTLLPGPSFMTPLRAAPERGVTVKTPQDIESPAKREYLFEP